MNNVEKLYGLGQSIWYDNIQRRLLENGELDGMIKRREIFGVTSNPSIFQNAIAKSSDYDGALKTMAWAGWSAEEIFWELAIEDIRNAADMFKPVYEESEGRDGYVSLEVNPVLAHDADGTFREALNLWHRVDRENLMIKIPATVEGVKAVKKAIAAGLNVNVTLIFSVERYQEVIDAYLGGLEERLAAGKQIENIASVASFFISRMDSKVDPQLEALESNAAAGLLGRAAISNARLAYQIFKKNFTSEKFTKLAEAGGKLQRPLWASTSTKNPTYRDVLYVEELVGADTINTVPPQTLTAFIDHGKAEETIEKNLQQAGDDISKLESLGINMTTVTRELEEEGVDAFAQAFSSLLETIDGKARSAQNELGALTKSVEKQVKELDEMQAAKRLFEVDATLWTDDPAGQAEIEKRCEWLNAPWKKGEANESYPHLRKHCQENGFTTAVLLGMGGSSLAPEVLRLVNGITADGKFGGMDMIVLDSTDPGQVLDTSNRAPVENTLFIVSSKSGGTAEVNAFLDYFWQKCIDTLGNKSGEHFIAITDPGTKLEAVAKEKDFWHVFAGDPKVGGRNSALTAFGLVPAALIGMDVDRLLKNAISVAEQCVPEVPTGANPGAMLGAVLGAAWKTGKDKLTILTDPEWDSFGSWMEQLVAESSGKNGKGIIPIVNEPEIGADKYQYDRLFVYLNSQNSKAAFVSDLKKAGHPVLEMKLENAYDLGGQFYLWEVATAIACAIMKVNSFDQPDVQENKTRTISKIAEYHETTKLKEEPPKVSFAYADIYGSKEIVGPGEVSLHDLILTYLHKVCKSGDYVAINAYLPRNKKNTEELTRLRENILAECKTATTLGFGPRFLHSTGQLHKGGPDKGVFIQITADAIEDAEIPNQGLTFSVLEKAQALGDYEVLESRERRLIRIHLKQADHTHLLK
jgi:transaldolase / glucose-6-phosphate isomerase